MCINNVPKYGNDDDFADEWAVWVMNTWQDSIDWINTQKIFCLLGAADGLVSLRSGYECRPRKTSWGLPNGRIHPRPVADAISPAQGMDRNGRQRYQSAGKLPKHRLAGGGPLNSGSSPTCRYGPRYK